MPVLDYTFRSAAKTDVGLVRDLNEDACLLLDEYGLFAVADGMGGYDAGEVASQLALDTLRQAIEIQQTRRTPTEEDLTIEEPVHSAAPVTDSGITEAMSADAVEAVVIASLVPKRDHGITEVEFVVIEDNTPVGSSSVTATVTETPDQSATEPLALSSSAASTSTVNFILVSPVEISDEDFPMLKSVVDGEDIPMLDETFGAASTASPDPKPSFDDDDIPVVDDSFDDDFDDADDLDEHDEALDAASKQAALDWLQQSVHEINEAVYQASCADQGLSGMGTTIAIARFGARHIDVAHVGDSRIYRFRNGELLRLTKDHSLVQEQLDAGHLDEESARHVAHRNIVTRAIGPYPAVKADVNRYDILPHDKFMLCSDGITEELSDHDLHDVLARDLPPSALCDKLVQAALDNGGHDNMTVAIIIIDPVQDEDSD